jgi:transcriptional regulator with XRE-family HTH domain
VTGTGEWLKRARLRVAYAREEDLAADMGVSRSAVANWETERTRPSMANAERLAALLKRPRSEVLGKFGYPVGGGEPLTVLPTVIPPEWLAAIRAEIAAGVADGMAQVLDQLRGEGLLPEADRPPRRQPRRRPA